jgi:maltose-binding protein MalE
MGKHKYIETPEKMWEYFEQYRKEVKDNPRKKHVFVGKDGNSDYEMLERPLTMEGFENYVFELGIIGDLAHYFANTNDAYTDYLTICSRIKKAIRQDQIEGGMVGQYNPSITQRLNGLKEQSETEINAKIETITGMEIK